MIRMTAEIELLAGAGEIQTDSISITPSGNNISASIADVVSVRRSGSNPFLFGASKLGNGEVFSSGEPYFIGSELSDDKGNFETPYTLSFSIDNLDTSNINFSILFDTYNNAYPKTIRGEIYDGSNLITTLTVVQNETLFIFSYASSITGDNINFKVIINDWSMPKYPVRIQSIYTGIKLFADRRNMLSLSAPIKDRSDNEQPSYGIISNSGSLSIIDGTGEIKEYARMKLLTPDLNVQIWLEDTLTKKKQVIGKFKTNKWTYNNNNFEVNIELKDDLEEIQDSLTDGFELNRNPMTFKEIYDWIIDKIETTLPQFKFKELDQKTLNLLSTTTNPYPYLEMDNLWQQLSKLCNILGMHVYENANKEIIVYSDFGG